MPYLDHNATAPLEPVARAAWLAAQDGSWGNPASVHGAGQQARHAVDQAKATMARGLGVRAHELVLTSGGTEANATVIASACGGGGDAVATAIEHSSVLRNLERWATAVHLVAVDATGRVASAALAAAMTPATRLVCIQFANNETGTLQDIPALVAAVRAVNPRTVILLDACQGVGKAPIDLGALGIDAASIAGHKCGAPKGIGLLYVRGGVTLKPLLAGGRQQQDRRSGTEDAALAAALAAALTQRLIGIADEGVRQARLLDDCFARIQAQVPQAQWIARAAPRLSNTLSLACPGVANDALVMRLDLAGFAVSTGAACMAARGQPSHVIAALGIDPALARSVIRVSIGPATTADELNAFAAAYVREVRAMR